MRDRLRRFLNTLPETATMACDYWEDFDLLGWVVGAGRRRSIQSG